MFKLKKINPGNLLVSAKDSALKVGKKVGKRNLAIILAVVLLGGALYINYLLFSDLSVDPGTTDADVPMYDGNENDAALVGGNADENENIEVNATDSYFATSLISRQRARDEAIEVLQLVIDNPEALTEAKTQASDKIDRIASDIEKESNIETLVKAKGFEECIAVISDNTCNVIVKTDSLLPNELAQIQEIVFEQTNILPANIKIIGKN